MRLRLCFDKMQVKRTLNIQMPLAFILCFLAACGALPSVTVNGTPVISPSSPSSQATPQLNMWYKAAPGVDIRYEDWKGPGGDEDTVTIVRFDLHYVALSVAYQPDHPLLMKEWMQQEHAIAIINGGYFDADDHATALVVSNGQAFGESYNGFGGMLSVDAQGQTTLRSLQQQPYDPGNEQLEQATQSSPMLVLDGKATQFSSDASSSRRSIVAMDKQGRLLFIVSPNNAFSLGELADLLVSSDLSIVAALNLDGGASTGLYVNAGRQHIAIDSATRLPLVVVVKTR